MKYLKRIIMVVIMFLLVVTIVHAEGDSIKIDAPSMASKKDEFSVDLILTSEQEVSEFKSTFTYETSALELLSIENKNGWKMTSTFSKSSPLALDFSHENGLTGETTIASLHFRVKSDVTKASTSLTIEGTTKNKEDGTINTLEKVTTNIDIKSTDNTLSGLKLNNDQIVNFSPNQYTYTLQVESSVTTASFEATLNDKSASFKSGYEPKTNAPLDYGENVFEMVVVAASGDEKKYIVTVIRQDNRGTNNDLKSLLVNGNPKLFTFDKNTLAYAVTTHKLTTIEVTATPEDTKATVRIEKPETIVIGTNEIRVVVVSENNVEKVYTIIVNNLDRDVDTTLSDIELFNCSEELNFEKDVYDYELMYKSKYKDSLVIKPILNNIDEAEIDQAKLEDDMAKIGPGRTVSIVVKAKDGNKEAERVYTITFKKDNRVNFFLLLALIIFIVLLVIFIKLLISNKKIKKSTKIYKPKEKEKVIETEEELEKTKRLEKVNLE